MTTNEILEMMFHTGDTSSAAVLRAEVAGLTRGERAQLLAMLQDRYPERFGP